MLSGTYGEVQGKTVLKDPQLPAEPARTIITSAFGVNPQSPTAANQVASAIADDAEHAPSNASTLAEKLVGTGAAPVAEPTKTAQSSNGTLTVSGLAQGYYLVVVDRATAGDQFQAAPAAMLVDVDADGATVKTKSATPSVDKQVDEVSEDGHDSWGKTADAQMAEAVPYRITGTLPSDWSEFKTYHYAFVDTLDPELEADPATVRIELIDPAGSPAKDITSAFAVTYADHKLTATVNDLKAAVPAQTTYEYTVRLSYTAHLVKGAATPGTKNPADNYVYIEYTRDPSAGGLGRTTESRARLLTWKIELDKTDGAANPKKLAGATFTLQDHAGAYVQADGTVSKNKHEFTTDKNGIASVAGLDAGTYTLTETAAPSGYAKLADPVHVKLTSKLDESAGEFGAAVDNSAVKVSRVDGASGTATLTIKNTANPPAGDHENPNNPSNPSNPSNPQEPGKKTPGKMPKTGDILYATALAFAAAAAILMAVGVMRQRRAALAGNVSHADDDPAHADASASDRKDA